MGVGLGQGQVRVLAAICTWVSIASRVEVPMCTWRSLPGSEEFARRGEVDAEFMR